MTGRTPFHARRRARGAWYDDRVNRTDCSGETELSHRRRSKEGISMRKLLPAAAIGLLLLGILLVLAGWARSYLWGDYFNFYHQPQILELRSNDGLVLIVWGQLESRGYPQTGWHWYGSFWPFERDFDMINADLDAIVGGTVLGFGHRHSQVNGPAHTSKTREVVLPWWALSLPFLVALALLVYRLRRSVQRMRWIGSGCCDSCGYDLQASPDRCPECGTVPVAESISVGGEG